MGATNGDKTCSRDRKRAPQEAKGHPWLSFTKSFERVKDISRSRFPRRLGGGKISSKEEKRSCHLGTPYLVGVAGDSSLSSTSSVYTGSVVGSCVVGSSVVSLSGSSVVGSCVVGSPFVSLVGPDVTKSLLIASPQRSYLVESVLHSSSVDECSHLCSCCLIHQEYKPVLPVAYLFLLFRYSPLCVLLAEEYYRGVRSSLSLLIPAMAGATPLPQGSSGNTSGPPSEIAPLISQYYVPLPPPRSNGAPHFDGTGATEFFRTYEEMFLEYRQDVTTVGLARLPRYCTEEVSSVIRSLAEYLDENWSGLKVKLLQRYKAYDRIQLESTPRFLERYKNSMIEQSGQESKEFDLQSYLLTYRRIALPIMQDGRLSSYTACQWFVEGLPHALKKTVMRKTHTSFSDPSTVNFDKLFKEAESYIDIDEEVRSIEASRPFDKITTRELAPLPAIPHEPMPLPIGESPPEKAPEKTILKRSKVTIQPEIVLRPKVDPMEDLANQMSKLMLPIQSSITQLAESMNKISQGQQQQRTQGGFNRGNNYGNSNTGNQRPPANVQSYPPDSFNRGMGGNQPWDTRCHYCQETTHFRRECSKFREAMERGLVFIGADGLLHFGNARDGGPRMPVAHPTKSMHELVLEKLANSTTPNTQAVAAISVVNDDTDEEDSADEGGYGRTWNVAQARSEESSSRKYINYVELHAARTDRRSLRGARGGPRGAGLSREHRETALEKERRILNSRIDKEKDDPRTKNLRPGKFVEKKFEGKLDEALEDTVERYTIENRGYGVPDEEEIEMEEGPEVEPNSEGEQDVEEFMKKKVRFSDVPQGEKKPRVAPPGKAYTIIKHLLTATNPMFLDKVLDQSLSNLTLRDVLNVTPELEQRLKDEKKAKASQKEFISKDGKNVRVEVNMAIYGKHRGERIIKPPNKAANVYSLVMEDILYSTKSPRIPITMNDLSQLALVDSGSEINMMSPDMVAEMGLAYTPGIRVDIVDASGTANGVLGIVENVEVQVGQVATIQSFVIYDGSQSIILGMPYMTETSMSVKCRRDGRCQITIYDPLTNMAAIIQAKDGKERGARRLSHILGHVAFEEEDKGMVKKFRRGGRREHREYVSGEGY